MANAGSGATWQMGDANYDGVVNLLDLDMWKANDGLPAVGSSLSGTSVADVPEPGTLAMLAARTDWPVGSTVGDSPEGLTFCPGLACYDAFRFPTGFSAYARL